MSGATPDGDDYWSMRGRRERAEALMAELELDKARKSTLDREKTVRAIFGAFRQLRDSGMVLGRRVAPSLAAISDPREIRIAIDRAQADIFDSFVKRSLQSLVDNMAGGSAALPDDLRAPAAAQPDGPASPP
jgi:hypothetical protein